MDKIESWGWILVILGILKYFGGRREQARERLRVADALGEVVKVETRWWKTDDTGVGPVSIRFLALTGESTFTIRAPTKKYQIGDRIPLNYEPGDPVNVGLKSGSGDPRWGLIAVAIGIAMLVFRRLHP